MNEQFSILVVDDQEINRDLLLRRLKHEGYQAFEADGGLNALKAIDEHPVDMVLLDIMMPDVDGNEVLRRIRAQYGPTEMPVIMVTAKDERDAVVESFSLGANDYITKPVDVPVLLARVRTQLALKKAEDGLRQLNEGLEKIVNQRTKELVRTNRALGESERRYHNLYDENPAMFYTIDTDGNIVSANRFGADRLGYKVDELIGKPASLLYPQEMEDTLLKHINKCMHRKNKVFRWETDKLLNDGSSIRARESFRSITTPEGINQLLVVCEDITEVKELSEKLSYQERHDKVTDLINREEFKSQLENELETAILENTEHVLCYLDLDQFKIINDTCGHEAGDELLLQIAGLLSEEIDNKDILARTGGDEFALLLKDCPAKEGMKRARSIRKAIDSYQFEWIDQRFHISVSIGLVPVNGSIKRVSELLSIADTACFAAKEEGRNRVHLFKEDDKELQQRHGEMRWVGRIHEALDKNLFRLYYQTIMPTATEGGSGLHYEILLRMADKDGGEDIPPGLFLPAAERYFLSPKVDRWVIENTLKWLKANPSHLEKLELCSINLSGHSLVDMEFRNFLDNMIHELKIPPEKISFEVTETAAIANLKTAMSFINSLKGCGCHFSLDDFGTGMSSFGYLKTLPVDYLKIDGQFVRNILQDPIDEVMVKAIHEIGRVMGKQTIAEFVENEDTINRLREIGVDYVQGFGVARPAPIEELQD